MNRSPRPARRATRAYGVRAVSLPAPVSGLVGREKEISAVIEALDGWRLVTLTGAPGIGKTRLALEVARRSSASDRAHFVDLASLVDPSTVAPAVAAAFSLRDLPGRDPTDALLGYLGDRRALVLLDNCEHLLDASSRLVDVLLHGCPSLRVLATSRAALGIVGERVWQVPPLSLPDLDGVTPTPEALRGSPAGELFAERASEAQPEFVLDDHAAAAVTEVCRRLDGIPLAIELAAARVAMLTPAEIAWRLDDRFALLQSTSPVAVPRHQTLGAALDWSHDLLSDSERALLRRLSVFVGGFELDAAEAVCADDGLAPAEVLGVLTRLSAKSLVGADVRNDVARYRLLETIRAYAADRLVEAGEHAALSEAHARCFLNLAETAEPELTGASQRRWLGRLEAERGNLRQALEWCRSDDRADAALRLAGALTLFWRVRCHFVEGREALAAAVAAADGQDLAARAKALWGLGLLTMMAGDRDGATAPLEESVTLHRELGDRRGCARALLILADAKEGLLAQGVQALLDESTELSRQEHDSWCLAHACGLTGFGYVSRGELRAARPRFEECIAVARAAEDDQSLRIGLVGLGWLTRDEGDLEGAASIFEEMLAAGRRLGEDYATGIALWSLGEIAVTRGDYGRARRLLDESLALLERSASSGELVPPMALLARVSHARGQHRAARQGFKRALALAGNGVFPALLCWKGELALDQGDLDTAGDDFGHARTRAVARDDSSGLAQALRGLGDVARAAGDLDESATLHHDALVLARDIGEEPAIAESLDALAGLAADAGRHTHAARLLGGAQALRARTGAARLPWQSSGHTADLALAREGLPAGDFEAALSQGTSLPIRAMLAEACLPGDRQARGWLSLTQSEWQVAELVADGLTNREISARLFISVSTVKAHLTRVFRKLGVSRRSELARDAARLRAGAIGAVQRGG